MKNVFRVMSLLFMTVLMINLCACSMGYKENLTEEIGVSEVCEEYEMVYIAEDTVYFQNGEEIKKEIKLKDIVADSYDELLVRFTALTRHDYINDTVNVYHYDIDQDGTKELIFSNCEFEAGRAWLIYTIRDNKTYYLGYAPGSHSVLETNPDGAGIYVCHGQMDHGYGALVTIENGQIVITDAWEEDVDPLAPDYDGYYSPGGEMLYRDYTSYDEIIEKYKIDWAQFDSAHHHCIVTSALYDMDNDGIDELILKMIEYEENDDSGDGFYLIYTLVDDNPKQIGEGGIYEYGGFYDGSFDGVSLNSVNSGLYRNDKGEGIIDVRIDFEWDDDDDAVTYHEVVALVTKESNKLEEKVLSDKIINPKDTKFKYYLPSGDPLFAKVV